MILDYLALAIIVFVVLTFVYGILAINDIPYEIVRRRDHPYRDAIMAAGWVSLFILHAIWPLLWIWAMANRRETRPDLRLAEMIVILQSGLKRREASGFQGWAYLRLRHADRSCG